MSAANGGFEASFEGMKKIKNRSFWDAMTAPPAAIPSKNAVPTSNGSGSSPLRLLQLLSSGKVVPTVDLHESTHLPLAAFQAALKELVAAGLAERATGGLVITASGREMIQDFALA